MEPMTKKELATLAGYTYRRMHDIDRDLPENEKLFQESGGGKYDPAVFVQRWVQYNVQREHGTTESLEDVKARHEQVKTRKTELEVARLAGELVAVEDVQRLWSDVVLTVQRNLLNLPHKVAPMVTMQENVEVIAAVIDEEIRRALEQMAETPLPEYAVTEDAGQEE